MSASRVILGFILVTWLLIGNQGYAQPSIETAGPVESWSGDQRRWRPYFLFGGGLHRINNERDLTEILLRVDSRIGVRLSDVVYLGMGPSARLYSSIITVPVMATATFASVRGKLSPYGSLSLGLAGGRAAQSNDTGQGAAMIEVGIQSNSENSPSVAFFASVESMTYLYRQASSTVNGIRRTTFGLGVAIHF